MSDSDEALARRAAGGDAAAVEVLLRRHHDAVFRTAWRLCGHREDAQDIAQEVCIRVARGLRSFDGRSAFRTWLYRITLNAARDAWRRGRRQAARSLSEFADGGEALAAENGVAEREIDLTRAWAALDVLPPAQREAVFLVHVEGLGHGETARVLGCAESTVSWRLFQARRTLRARLDPFHGEVTT